ncbi:MAG: response regulator [Polyangiaceae bacterium]|nr:response regulator [Myxococcales bacterium]MCB9588471.1 response regulator [Polyangiaceae bacterium]
MDLEAENAKLRAQVAALELRLDQTFEQSTAVKLVIDPADGSILEANPAAISFYGYSAEEFSALRITDLNQLPPELVAEELAAAREQKRSYFEFKHRLKSGAVRDVQVYSGPVRMYDRDCLYSIICDITDRTQLADQLAHAQRMDALGRLAGGVAHDINNLLTALDMLASLIRSDVEHARPVETHLREVEQLTQRGASLTGQLLAFCRRQMLEPRLLDLGAVMTGVETLLRRLLNNRVSLTVDIPKESIQVVADLTRLEQVLLNLVLNARDAMPEGGQIGLNLERISTTPDLREELEIEWPTAAKVTITDQGVGMDEDTLRHAFEPFFTTKPSGQGTGLGLSTVYGIVQQSGGRIRVLSQLNRGSRFELFFPEAVEPELLPEPAPPVESIAGGSETLLLVDDDGAVRTTLAAVLREAGYQVLEACDGEEALAMLCEQRFAVDLVVSDVVMPKLNGPEFVARARARFAGLRVLYMSGFLDLPSVGSGLKGVGGDPLLTKPFPASRLVGKVRDLLDSAPQRRTLDKS